MVGRPERRCVLYVEDADRAASWYGHLGFVKEWQHQFEPGFAWFVSVARGHVRLYLSERAMRGPYVSEEFQIAVDEEDSQEGNATS